MQGRSCRYQSAPWHYFHLSMQEILEWALKVQKMTGGVWVCGDVNSGRWVPPYRQVQGQFMLLPPNWTKSEIKCVGHLTCQVTLYSGKSTLSGATEENHVCIMTKEGLNTHNIQTVHLSVFSVTRGFCRTCPY